MVLIECNNVKKYFGEKLILDIKNLKICSGERIGVVGVNGAGKTTLINILSKRLEPDEGYVKLYAGYSYITQLGGPESKCISREMASKFKIQEKFEKSMSGGEAEKFKIADSLDKKSPIIFADEPTENLDIEGINLLEEKLSICRQTLVIISHDRSFLDKLCKKIIEIEFGKVKIYNGNYSSYTSIKKQEQKRAEFEYEKYSKENKRLNEVINDTKERSKSVKAAPKRMGNSEARLNKMGDQKAKASLDRAVKNTEKRLEHLDIKEKPKNQEAIKLRIQDSEKLYSKIIIEGTDINKSFDNRIIFKNADFVIFNNSKTALIGPNGSGKSTLVKMILNGNSNIKTAHGSKIGYFSQSMDILDKSLTIMENVQKSSIYSEHFIRTFLARLLFKREDIYKKVNVLSGGERVKVSLAKILLQDMNMLILDEPTNYLDISSIEVLEKILRDYDSTLLFISHDIRLIESIADHIMTIENCKIKMFRGNYKEYLNKKNTEFNDSKKEIKNQIFILKNRLAGVLGKLSVPSKKDNIDMLNKEYYDILENLKKYTAKLH